MKYDDIVTLVNLGALRLTTHSLSVGAAYTVTKFKCEAKKLYEEWLEKSNALVKEAGIENGEAFDNRLKELEYKLKNNEALNNAETKEFDDLNAKRSRLIELRRKLAEDTVNISLNPMPYTDWHNLKNENKDLKYGDTELLEIAEPRLENILWTAPE